MSDLGNAEFDGKAIPGITIIPSSICLGTAMYGSAILVEESFRMLDVFYEAGGNFLDTAHCYADWIPGTSGASEKTIGQWLKKTGIRSQLIIGTKGGHSLLSDMKTHRFSPAAFERDLSQSLERLNTDYIDLYWIHKDDPLTPIGEILEVLDGFRSSGRIRAFGASNLTLERLNEAQKYAHSKGIMGVSASQIGWSLAELQNQNEIDPSRVYMNESLLGFHRQSGLPVVAYSSQAVGFFAGKYGQEIGFTLDTENPYAQWAVRHYYTEKNFERYSRAMKLARVHECTPNDIALSYIFSQNFPAFPIVGCRNREQVISSCRAGRVTLTQEEILFLEQGAPMEGLGLMNKMLRGLGFSV